LSRPFLLDQLGKDYCLGAEKYFMDSIGNVKSLGSDNLNKVFPFFLTQFSYSFVYKCSEVESLGAVAQIAIAMSGVRSDLFLDIKKVTRSSLDMVREQRFWFWGRALNNKQVRPPFFTL
jgi:hypothetical protein